MAIVVKLKENKEPVNELLGTVVAWGLIAGLLAKIFGFRFNFSDTNEMRQWGFQLGDAFKFSRQKLKGLPPDVEARATAVLDAAERKIQNRVKAHGRLLETDPARARTELGNVNTELGRIADDAVNQIESILKGSLGGKARARAEEMVSQIRGTFDDLADSLVSVTRPAIAARLRSDAALNTALDAAVASLPPANRAARKDAILNAMIAGIIP